MKMGDETLIGSDPSQESTVPLRIECLQIEIPSSNPNPSSKSHRTRISSFFKSWPGLRILRQTVNKREEISLSVSSPGGERRSFPAKFLEKISCSSVANLCYEWIKHPMNIALFIWLVCVGVFSSIQGLLLLGMLDKEFPAKSSRSRWIEINNQVLNAMFTLMSLYQHPSLFHHIVLVCRWRPEAIIELRKIYCRNGARRKNEFAHITFVVVLLHITCVSQYILCGLYWGYTISTRPEFFENIFNGVGIAAAVIAGVYAMYGPLGRDEEHEHEPHEDEDICDFKEEDGDVIQKGRDPIAEPEWRGSIFDCKEDVSVTSLSFFCSFCVFGWNMERLGFGNMYVHIAMFFLLCFAPLWIFGIAAMHISNDWVRNAVSISGLILSVCGLLYGGFWRVQMRRRFKLSGHGGWCGSGAADDYLQWLFCCYCALAQEVRTGNFYEIEEGKFFKKNEEDDDDDEEDDVLLCPLPWESKASLKATSSSSSWSGREDLGPINRPPLEQVM